MFRGMYHTPHILQAPQKPRHGLPDKPRTTDSTKQERPPGRETSCSTPIRIVINAKRINIPRQQPPPPGLPAVDRDTFTGVVSRSQTRRRYHLGMINRSVSRTIKSRDDDYASYVTHPPVIFSYLRRLLLRRHHVFGSSVRCPSVNTCFA